MSNKLLADRVALITGAAQGIGRGTAIVMAQKGADVIAVDLQSNSKNLSETVQLLKELNGNCIAIEADVGNQTEVEQMISQVIEKFGKLDIIVNNAGIARGNLLLKLSEKDWDDVLRVNVKGAFFVTQAAARHMVKREYGKIINISSIYAKVGSIGEINYSATKAALIGFTKSTAKELARYKIYVNAILPGPIDTPILRNIPEKYLNSIIADIPLGRVGQPEDIGYVAAFLASDEASFMTGALVEVSGGWHM